MALNWLAVLKVVPWSTVLNQAPGVVEAANKLLTNSKRKKAELNTTNELEALRNRIAALEEQDQADAAVIKQLADEAANIAAATHIIAVRVRAAVLFAAAAILVAILALVMVLFSR